MLGTEAITAAFSARAGASPIQAVPPFPHRLDCQPLVIPHRADLSQQSLHPLAGPLSARPPGKWLGA
jgi:hypothetical protein